MIRIPQRFYYPDDPVIADTLETVTLPDGNTYDFADEDLREIVPMPVSGEEGKYLKGDGTWDHPSLSELGMSVVNGKLCVTYQREVSS